jgi:thymidylate synthase
MKQYKDLIKDVMENGLDSQDRTGTGTKSVFGRQVRFDLSKGFPMVTTKKTFWKGVVGELLWMLSGSTNTNDIPEFMRHWWTPWADEDGSLGPTYGQQFRNNESFFWASKEEQSRSTSQNTPFMVTSPQGEDLIFMSLGELSRKYNLNISAVHRCLTGMLKTHKGWSNFRYLEKDELVLRYRKVDQLADVIGEIKNNPNSRRLNISLWNASRILDMKLPPCHGNLIQFYVRNGKLSCSMYQRSADLFIGVPVNIAFYSLLTHLIANECGLDRSESLFIHLEIFTFTTTT